MPATGDRITKRKDGRYMARYTVHTADGRKRKTIYGRKERMSPTSWPWPSQTVPMGSSSTTRT